MMRLERVLAFSQKEQGNAVALFLELDKSYS
jgi:hypothetical protein